MSVDLSNIPCIDPGDGGGGADPLYYISIFHALMIEAQTILFALLVFLEYHL